MLDSVPVFGEARSDRFMRKTRKEVRLMEQENGEAQKEIEKSENLTVLQSEEYFAVDEEMEIGDTHDDGDYDDFEYELMLRSSDYL